MNKTNYLPLWSLGSNDKIQKINKSICNMSSIIGLWRKIKQNKVESACQGDAAILYKVVREGHNDNQDLSRDLEVKVICA